MNKKIRITENTLRKMIVKAINEATGGSLSSLVEDWFESVVIRHRSLTNSIQFTRVYEALLQDPYCLYAVKMGVGKESKNQSNYEGGMTKPPLKVDEMFAHTNIGEEILSGFLAGDSTRVRNEDSERDGLTEENIKYLFYIYANQNGFNPELEQAKQQSLANGGELAWYDDIPVEKKERVNVGGFKGFMTKLCSLITMYAIHYTRDNYNDWAMRWGVGSSEIGGNEGNGIESDEEYDDDSPMSVSNDQPELNKVMGYKKYDEKLLSVAQKILTDDNGTLSQQERDILQCMVNAINNKMNDEQINNLTNLADIRHSKPPSKQTSKAEERYVCGEIAKQLGMTTDQVVRVIGNIRTKILNSNYIKMVNEKRQRQMLNHIVNEVMSRILG